MKVRKIVNFNGQNVTVVATLEWVATERDRANCGIQERAVFLVVKFHRDGVDFRGLWRLSECTIVEEQQ